MSTRATLSDPAAIVRDVMDAACEYHGTDWYAECETCDYQQSGLAALDALVAERAEAQAECNICGVLWPEHHPSCAYPGNVRDKEAAEAELAEMRHQGVIAWREIAEDELKDAIADRDAAILDRDHWYNDPESRDAVARAEARAEAAEARVTELEAALRTARVNIIAVNAAGFDSSRGRAALDALESIDAALAAPTRALR